MYNARGVLLLFMMPQVRQEMPQSNMTRVKQHILSPFSWVSQLLHLVAFRSSVRLYFCINKKIQKEVVSLSGGDKEGSSSGSVSNVVAQEHDVVWGGETDLSYELISHEKNLPNNVKSASHYLHGHIKRCTCVCSLTCDDGGGLAPDLVLVNILAVVQFPLH